MTDAVIIAPGERRLAGRTLLDHAIERLAASGIARIHAAGANDPTPSLHPLPADPDPARSIRRALAAGQLPDEPFFLVDGNVAWFDGPIAALARLLQVPASAPDADAFLLLVRATETLSQPSARPHLTLDPLGLVRRPPDRTIAPFVAAGLRLVTPRFFEPPRSVESGTLDALRDRAIDAGRAQGIVHDGIWLELETDADLAEAEATLADRLAGLHP